MGLVASTVGRESDEDESLGLHNISLWSEILIMQNMMHLPTFVARNQFCVLLGSLGSNSSFLPYLPFLKVRI